MRGMRTADGAATCPDPEHPDREDHVMSAEPSISLNEQANRYELSLGQERVGELVYRDHGETRVFLHTEVDPAHRGKGLASKLIAWALDNTRDAGMHLRVECPAVSEYLKDHPEADFR